MLARRADETSALAGAACVSVKLAVGAQRSMPLRCTSCSLRYGAIDFCAPQGATQLQPRATPWVFVFQA